MIASLMCMNCGKRGICAESKSLCGRCKATQEMQVNTNAGRRTPKRPTLAAPGTEAKIQVMRRRIERGEHLYHPLDNRQIYRLVEKRGRNKVKEDSKSVKSDGGGERGGILTTLLGYRVEDDEE